MVRIIIPVFIFLLGTVFSFSQPEIEWVKNIGGVDMDECFALIETAEGGFLVGGRNFDLNPTTYGNKILYRLSSNGEIEWRKDYGPGSFKEILENDMGEFVLLAVIDTIPQNRFEIIKIDASGNVLASNKFGTFVPWTNNYGLEKDHSGGYIAFSSTSTTIYKVNEVLELVWERTLDNLDNTAGFSDLTLAEDGSYIVLGPYYNNSNPPAWHYDMIVRKFNSNWEMVWSKIYGGSGDEGNSENNGQVICTKNEDIVFVTQSQSMDGDVGINYGEQDWWVVRLDRGGELLWERSIGGSDRDNPNGLFEAPNGNLLISGYVFSDGGTVPDHYGSLDGYLAQLSPAGELLWSKNIGGSDNDAFWAGIPTRDDGYLFGGWVGSSDFDLTENNGQLDMFIVKVKDQFYPNVDLGPDLYICIGDTLTLNAYDPSCNNCTYLWSDGSTDTEISLAPFKPGRVSVQITDEEGQIATDEIWINVPNVISVECQILRPDRNADNGRISLNLIGGTAPFEVTWSTGASGASLEAIPKGEYTVFVEDAIGCIFEKTIKLESGCESNLFPNPNNGEFQFEFYHHQPEFQLNIYNSLGQLVRKEIKQSNTLLHINLPTFPSGLYYVEVEEENCRQFFKMIIVE